MRFISLLLCLAILANKGSGSAHRRDESDFEFQDLEAGLLEDGCKEGGFRQEDSPTSITECGALESSSSNAKQQSTALRRVPQEISTADSQTQKLQRAERKVHWSDSVPVDVSPVIHPVPVRVQLSKNQKRYPRGIENSDFEAAGRQRGACKEEEIPTSITVNDAPAEESCITNALRRIPELVVEQLALEQDDGIISLQRTKPIGNWSPRIPVDVATVFHPVPERVQPSENQIRKDLNKAVRMIIGAVSQDDALLLRSREARFTPTDTYARVIRNTLVNNRMDLALRFAEAAKETVNAHVVDRHFRVSDPASKPLPRLAAFIRGLDTLYFATITHEELDYTLLEDAILKPHIWCGPIFI